MDHTKLLLALGDYRTVARKLGRHHSTISRWKTAGIPPEHWPQIIRLAKRANVRITLDQLAAASPVFGRTAARSRRNRGDVPLRAS
jgi:hypothetical protein